MEQITLQPTELRIGNWFYEKPKSTQSLEKIHHRITNGRDIDNSEFYSPIPLTPDILEKTSPDKDLVDDGDNKRLAIGHMVGNMEYFLHLYDGTIWIDQHDTGYKFVHQYQNLYYMLSGKELEITL